MSMAFARGLGYCGVGFAGAQVYQNTDSVREVAEGLFRKLQSSPLVLPSGGAGLDREVSALMQQINALAGKVDTIAVRGTAGPSTIVVRDSSGRSASFTTTAVVGLLVLGGYARYRGVRLQDFSIVTAGTFRTAIDSVNGTLTTVRELVTTVRVALSERIEQLRSDVEGVGSQIDGVDAKVDGVGAQVNEVGASLSDVDAKVDANSRELESTRLMVEANSHSLREAASKQDYANLGIRALCGVVGEMLQTASSTPAITQLRSFARLESPPAAQPRLAGAESRQPAPADELECISADDHRRRANDNTKSALDAARLASSTGAVGA